MSAVTSPYGPSKTPLPFLKCIDDHVPTTLSTLVPVLFERGGGENVAAAAAVVGSDRDRVMPV